MTKENREIFNSPLSFRDHQLIMFLCPDNATPEFKLLPYKDAISPGWCLATKEEVNANKETAKKLFVGQNKWMIAQLQDNYQLRGAGYGYDIVPPSPGFGFEEKFVVFRTGGSSLKSLLFRCELALL
jgi:hypothetical protein